MKTILINFTLLSVVIAGRWRRADDDNLDLTPKGAEQSCTTKTGKDGICVHEAQCTENYTIPLHGIVDDSDLRAGKCPGTYEWCCTPENTIGTKVPLKKNEGCIVSQGNECPYCVGLYRLSGNPYTRSPSGLYCGGTLLGSNTVLTTAGCAIATKVDKIWIQIPGENFNKHYTIKSLIKHPQYKSDTRENDLALMVLTENVQNGTELIKGACLDFRTPLAGQCTSFGFDKNDTLILTKLTVKIGKCTSRGTMLDASCGQTDSNCNVLYGSPVMCPFDGTKEPIVTGIARETCMKGTLNLESLMSSTSWLGEELMKIGLPGYNYTLTL